MDIPRKYKQKILNKRINAEKEGLKFLLSDEEVVLLLEDAGISFEDWGFSSGKGYVLARYKDQGNYEMGNCRFITQKENAAEKRISEKSRAASSKNSKFGLEKINLRENLIKRENSLKRYHLKRKEKAIEKRNLLNQSYTGEKNSQFGTMWITNGIINKKIKRNEEIPNGYKKGRII